MCSDLTGLRGRLKRAAPQASETLRNQIKKKSTVLCVMCDRDLSSESIFHLPCQHVMCRSCLMNATQEKNSDSTCKLCKTKFRQMDVARVHNMWCTKRSSCRIPSLFETVLLKSGNAATQSFLLLFNVFRARNRYTWLQDHAAMWIRSIRGYVATRLSGHAAPRLCCYACTWLRVSVVTWLRSYAARWQRSYPSTWLRGNGATWLG